MDHGEDRDLIAEALLVEQRPIALDVTGLFERAHAAQAGRRGDTDPAREFHVGDAAVVLQFFENLTVDGIESRGHSWPPVNGFGAILTSARRFTKQSCALTVIR